MHTKTFLLITFILFGLSNTALAQFNESQTGAWYMYFWNTTIKESSWGFQGDIQYRNWDIIGDLEQLLIRGGATYKPNNANVKFTLGYASITTGVFGDDNSTTHESRIYQEALIPQKVGGRFYLTHRFRYEQRFVDNQDFRSRYRYNLFLNVPLNKPQITSKTIYLAFYNELFINGERNIGDGRTVEIFDRNRTYGAVGYAFRKNIRIQLGAMRQITDNWEKTQLQLSAHHSF